MRKWIFTSLGLNTSIIGSIIIEELITLLYSKLISPLATACGKQLKWIIEYEKFKLDLWTGPCIGVGFERKLSFYLYMCYVQYILT